MILLNKKVTILAVVGLAFFATGWVVFSPNHWDSKFPVSAKGNGAQVSSPGKKDKTSLAKGSSSVVARDFDKHHPVAGPSVAPVPPRLIPLAATPLNEVSQEEEK